MTVKSYWLEISYLQTRYVQRPHRKIVKLRRDRRDAYGIATQILVMKDTRSIYCIVDEEGTTM